MTWLQKLEKKKENDNSFDITELPEYSNKVKEIEELDIEKNSLLGVPVLSEITKVKELVK